MSIQKRITFIVQGYRSLLYPKLSEMNLRAARCNQASPWYGNSPGFLVHWNHLDDFEDVTDFDYGDYPY